MKKPNLNKSEKSIDDLKITENLQKIKHKIAIMSGKGGVGKSTVAVNLGAIRQFIGDVHWGNLDYLVIDPLQELSMCRS